MTSGEKIEEILRLANELSAFYRPHADVSPLFYEANKILHIGWKMRDVLAASPDVGRA